MVDTQKRSFTEFSVAGNFDVWREHTAWAVDSAPMHADANVTASAFNAHEPPYRARVFFHDEGLISHLEYNAVALSHTKRHIEMSHGLVYLGRYPSGGIIANDLGRTKPSTPGTIVLFDYAKPFQEFHTRSIQQCLYIQKSALGLRDRDQIPPQTLVDTSPMARLLNAQMDAVFGKLYTDTPVFSDAAYLQLLACIQLAINPVLTARDVRARARNALFELICDYIRTHIHLPNLGTNMILAQFGVSRAGLYRMFVAEGGVETHITRVRMIRAAFEIATSPKTRGQIATVVEKWGFSSNAHFNRLVRRAFGVSPSSLFLAPIGTFGETGEKPHLVGVIKPYLFADAI